MDPSTINWCGKLMELGTKAKFVPIFEIKNTADGFGEPKFLCSCEISEYSVKVEHSARNKKTAKTAAAEDAYKKILAHTGENIESPIEMVVLKLKQLKLTENKVDPTIQFFKKFSSIKNDIDPTGINGNSIVNDNILSFSFLHQLVDTMKGKLTVERNENVNGDDREFQCLCEIRPQGQSTPIVYGFGVSSSSLAEAEKKAVKHLISVMRVFANQ